MVRPYIPLGASGRATLKALRQGKVRKAEMGGRQGIKT